MARSIEDIQVQIESYLVSSFADIGVVIDTTKWSKRNIMRLFCYIFAVCANYLEQLIDIAKTEIETNISVSTGGNISWLQSKVLAFQYESGVPQTIEIVNGIATYNPIDSSKRIITACSIVSPLLNSVVVKVAKSDPLEKLNTDELDSLQGYVNTIGTVGINYTCVSSDPDLVQITGVIYFDKKYSTSISSDVISTINSFLQSLSLTNFNGALTLSDIEMTIKGVTGVNDVVLSEVACRPATADFANRVFLVLDYQTLVRQWNSTAGYCVAETETGYTLVDKLTFTGE